MPTTIKVKAYDFESPYTDQGAAVEFRRLMEAQTPNLFNNDFASSLFTQARSKGSYSPRQLPWLHVLLAQHEGRPTKPNVILGPALTGFNLLHAHLANCRLSREQGGKGLLHPMIGLLVGDTNVVLKLAGPKSQHNGEVGVSSDHRYGHGTFYGWIDPSGNMTSRSGVPQEVADILRRVAQDPARAISEIGKESGRCCYCFANLTTTQSKIAGCGKTCSTNYGVDYPNAAETRAFLAENPEILEGASDRDRWA